MFLQSVKTRVIKNNLNPVWNESLMLSIPENIPPLKVVNSIVFSACVLRKNERVNPFQEFQDQTSHVLTLVCRPNL
jgi:hypothetical protein